MHSQFEMAGTTCNALPYHQGPKISRARLFLLAIPKLRVSSRSVKIMDKILPKLESEAADMVQKPAMDT